MVVKIQMFSSQNIGTLEVTSLCTILEETQQHDLSHHRLSTEFQLCTHYCKYWFIKMMKSSSFLTRDCTRAVMRTLRLQLHHDFKHIIISLLQASRTSNSVNYSILGY
ncbi:uncharacterized protein [Asterias amurensis]|uniref:uncharacterized protein n=1 Tax=Asterias amurensis TaxID=7602 RepID=UPI003AB7D9E7